MYAVGVKAHRKTIEMNRRTIALILILIVDVGYIAWGAGAAVAPEHLPGPGGKGILPSAFEGYTGGSWSELENASPLIAVTSGCSTGCTASTASCSGS